MREAVIVASRRTPLAKSFRGSFNMTRPDDQVAHAIRACLGDVPALDPEEIQDVIIGCGLPEGPQGQNIARVATLNAGLPASVSATTVNRFCSSGLQAINMAAQHVIVNGADAVLAGGVESITQVQNDKMRIEGMVNPRVQKEWPGLYMGMGQTAEIVADRYGISREDQDAYALASQQRTAAWQEKGWDRECIAPMTVTRMTKTKDGEQKLEEGAVVERDECNRPNTTLEGLAKLPPAFNPDGGTVTAGNASQLSDGASATLVMSSERAKQLGIEPMGIFRGFQVAGCRPEEMGIGPVFAVPKLLKQTGKSLDDIDVVELNEAFASQLLYCQRELQIPDEKLNPIGGSISIGHPYGMTGSRMTGQLLRQLARTGGRFGIVTMCVGGGMGAAGLFEAAS
jgi:acetyl-CoA acyltransferase